MRTAVVLLLMALLLLLAACATGSDRTGSLNFAAAFGWGGYPDADLTFAEFLGGDHTLTARFMPQHPKAYAGPAHHGRDAHVRRGVQDPAVLRPGR